MAQNHIANGALFKDPPIQDGKTHPLMHIALEVLGVKLNLAVWPQEQSKGGTVYWPVSGDYANKETKRLVDVTPTLGASQATQAAGAGETTTAQPAGDLPF